MEILDHIPEVPVAEEWEWLSDILTSYNGEEQRISVRGGVPRFHLSLNLKVTTIRDLDRLWTRLLKARNSVWLPEYQLATKATAESASGTARVYFDALETDIRASEEVLINGAIYEVFNLETDGATLTTNLTSTLPIGGLIVPVAEALLDKPSITRAAVNYVGNISVKGLLKRPRTTLTRPGTSDPLTYWNSVPVLDVRPLVNTEPQTSILDSQIDIDNKVSNPRLVDKWSEPKVKKTREYTVSRVPLGPCNSIRRHLDYWRYFLQYCRGSVKKFWLPTYREDLTLVGSVTSGASFFIAETFNYGLNVFPNQKTHIYLEIETLQGTHRCEVSSVGSSGDDTQVNITPSLPSGWVDIQRISYLIPSRLDGDSVTWEHHGMYSLLSLSFRSAENV